MAARVGIVGVFIASHDLIKSLAQEGEQRGLDLGGTTRIGQSENQTGGQPLAAIKLA